ncbi:hypothetical protein D9757_009605 [Collybiopsis confluens]|uniref:Protein kinase domain-containing protein n=1 Tax=Collybiopsis confluens TaxID=2823264 RepID=A0A8H5H4N8_9AGAR|nr:hypothetical protein D9757_009605 [Collybiopsis confluens]
MVRYFTAILKADSIFDSSYRFFGYLPLEWDSALTLGSLAEHLRTHAQLRGGNLHFFKLKEMLEFTSSRDVKAKFNPLLDHDSLSDIGDEYLTFQITMEELGIQQPDIRNPDRRLVPLVLVWTVPSEHAPVSTRSLTAIAEEPAPREAIARKAQDRPPPSTGAKSTNLVTSQDVQHLDAAYNHRPPELSPPPIAIYDPVFAKFRHEMATSTDTLVFSQGELDSAAKFIDASLRLYPNKHSRKNALERLSILGGGYWDTKDTLVNNSYVKPDGGRWVNSIIDSKSGPRAFSSLGELKNGGGDGGCDPMDQAQCDYIKIVSSEQYQSIRLVSCCPAFLISLSGHALTVCGAVFADRFFFESLAMMHIGPQAPGTPPSPIGGRSDMEFGIREVAKLLRTLNNCFSDLELHYGSLTSPAPLPPLDRSPIPSASNRLMQATSIPSSLPTPTPFDSLDPSRFVRWKSFIAQEQEYQLRYTRRLTNYMEKTVFQAVLTTGTDGRETDVVVKFAYRYGALGHRLLAQAGLAPRLYHCAFEESVGMWVIVMEYVPGRVCSGKLAGGERESLKQAIELLHAQNLVFGDLRGPNVIITPLRKVCLVDFEWCGTCIDTLDGDQLVPRVCYPTNISLTPEIGWAEGVGRDLVIEKEHDIHRLTQMCSS